MDNKLEPTFHEATAALSASIEELQTVMLQEFHENLVSILMLLAIQANATFLYYLLS